MPFRSQLPGEGGRSGLRSAIRSWRWRKTKPLPGRSDIPFFFPFQRAGVVHGRTWVSGPWCQHHRVWPGGFSWPWVVSVHTDICSAYSNIMCCVCMCMCVYVYVYVCVCVCCGSGYGCGILGRMGGQPEARERPANSK
jgi:hypothetical protein